ncbi:MAG: UvrB/UvrC motif-containing protein [Clostridia bacterium]|nr:UvrB/UvrC motif-containing protein [Clostridia bacterium]
MMNLLKNGKFGCENCYETFNEKINHLVKNLHGSSMHVGRKPKYIKENKIDVKPEKENKEESKLDKLNKDLKEAIKEERYEDAAKIRDEIKKLNKE